jgi:hypothetical protein
MPTYRAFLRIEPAGELAGTAAILDDVLGVVFAKAPPGRFDEFPAFVATASGLEYALLGIPAPGEQIQDDPIGDFDLHVTPASGNPCTAADISEELATRLNSDGRLRCWPAVAPLAPIFRT